MKSLVKNYIDSLTIDILKDFSLKNHLNLNNTELNYILNLLKNDYENILKNDSIYLEKLKNNINSNDYIKIKELYDNFKLKYKSYLI